MPCGARDGRRQALEDLLEELVKIQKAVNKLTDQVRERRTAAEAGQGRDHRQWLPVSVCWSPETSSTPAQLQDVADTWKRLVKLADTPNPKTKYKPVLKSIIAATEGELLHSFIKGSAIQTIGDTLRKPVQPISDPELLNTSTSPSAAPKPNAYALCRPRLVCCLLQNSPETRPSCRDVDRRIREDEGGQGHDVPDVHKDYTFSTELDVQEAADAHLILLCRFLMYLDDTQYKHLKGALDLRNGCGHPTGYQPDPVNCRRTTPTSRSSFY